MSIATSRPPKKTTVPPGRTSSSASCQASVGAHRLDDDVGGASVPGLGPERRRQLPPRGAAADGDDVRAGVLRRRTEHEPDRAWPDHGDGLAGLDRGPLDAVQAAGERLDEGRDLGGEAGRDREKVPLRDPGRHEQVLGVGAVQERAQVLAQRLLAAAAGRALPAGRRVRGHDTPPGCDVDPAELVAERARRLGQQEWMPAPEGLRVGAVGERHLDLDEDVALARLRPGDLLDPQVAGPVVHERPHGVKTTLTASCER